MGCGHGGAPLATRFQEDLMLSKAALDFLLRLTDWFHGHWEDPEWGKRPTTQILIALALRDLATGLHDAESRSQIQAAADKVIAKNGQAMTRA
jgi:hypothetical protein